MSFNDPIADLLTRIRNAKNAKQRFVDVPVSRIKLDIIKILKEQGFIDNFLVNDKKRLARIFLKYTAGRRSVINELKRVSKPGLRKYISYVNIPQIYGGTGVAILSTSKGIIDDMMARSLSVGGELLCLVW